jgi:hypothetical protein
MRMARSGYAISYALLWFIDTTRMRLITSYV